MKNMKRIIIVIIIILILLLIYLKFYKNNRNNSTNNNTNNDITNNNNTNNNNANETPGEIKVINKTGDTIIVEARCTLPITSVNNKIISAAPLPNYKPNYVLLSNDSKIFKIPEEGLSAVKIWAKFNCDIGTDSYKCLMGQSMQDWNENTKQADAGCSNSYYGCTPPIDSIFEATFGCTYDDKTKCALNPSKQDEKLLDVTFFDISHVDGYTLPYKLEIVGDNSKCDNNKGLKIIDGTKLTLDKCPEENKLVLKDTNINSPTYGKNIVVGCMSPCQKYTYSDPFGLNYTTNPNDTAKIFSEDAVKYCCPTPIKYVKDNNTVSEECTLKNGCTSSDNCGDLGIKETEYYKVIKKIVPDNYAFAYDDSNGLHTCPRKDIKYILTFYAPN